MASVLPVQVDSTVHLDARGGGRAMRVTWHPEAGDAGLVVLSLWHDRDCVGTFRLATADVPALVQTLVEALASSAGKPARPAP
jgi:hypothetical protein